jgi:hypothetical protein
LLHDDEQSKRNKLKPEMRHAAGVDQADTLGDTAYDQEPSEKITRAIDDMAGWTIASMPASAISAPWNMYQSECRLYRASPRASLRLRHQLTSA